MTSLRSMIEGPELVVAPVALNPIMARLAQDAGFQAVYLSGGSLGWLKCVTEANLTLPELAEVALAIRAATTLQLVLDAGGGWGDPVHMHRTMALSEAAGFAALEVEDQFLPRRVHHHIGEERLIEPEAMVQKIRELIAARRNPDTLVIARTNAIRVAGLDEALRRAELYRAAGADMIFVHTRDPEQMRKIGERLPAPLMIFAPATGLTGPWPTGWPRSRRRAHQGPTVVTRTAARPRSCRRGRRWSLSSSRLRSGWPSSAPPVSVARGKRIPGWGRRRSWTPGRWR